MDTGNRFAVIFTPRLKFAAYLKMQSSRNRNVAILASVAQYARHEVSIVIYKGEVLARKRLDVGASANRHTCGCCEPSCSIGSEIMPQSQNACLFSFAHSPLSLREHFARSCNIEQIQCCLYVSLEMG